MLYAAYPLKDLGYQVEVIGGGPGEIWGLDNQVHDDDDQRFLHLGIDGYPSGVTMLVDREQHDKCLAVFEVAATPPEGGTEIPEADVVPLLVSEYGWPEGTRLVDGLPVAPEMVE